MKFHWRRARTWLRLEYLSREDTECGKPVIQLQLATRERSGERCVETVKMSTEALAFLLKHGPAIQAQMGQRVIGDAEPVYEMEEY